MWWSFELCCEIAPKLNLMKTVLSLWPPDRTFSILTFVIIQKFLINENSFIYIYWEPINLLNRLPRCLDSRIWVLIHMTWQFFPKTMTCGWGVQSGILCIAQEGIDWFVEKMIVVTMCIEFDAFLLQMLIGNIFFCIPLHCTVGDKAHFFHLPKKLPLRCWNLPFSISVYIFRFFTILWKPCSLPFRIFLHLRVTIQVNMQLILPSTSYHSSYHSEKLHHY